MPRRKSTPSKRPLDPPQRRAPKRQKSGVIQRHRTEPLSLSAGDGWGEDDALQLQFPVDSSLASSLTVFCSDKSSATAVQLHLTLVENDQVKLHAQEHEDTDTDIQLSLSELFPHTYETWQPHVATLAEQKLLSLHIHAQRQGEGGDWSFSFSVEVAWLKYMESCRSRGLAPVLASPRASPMRAMHHVMIWLLKKTHDAQKELPEGEMPCRYRYWNEIEVLYDRFVGPNKAACAQFEGQTFAMPEIYARIDAPEQLRRDISAFDQVEASSTDLLPTLREYQKAAVSWMLTREKPPTQQAATLPVCVIFNKVAARQLRAYDPFCAAFHPEPPPIPLQQAQLRPESLDFSAVRGGILADEMGLGKTVEVIALVLGHRRPSLRAQLLSSHVPSVPDGDEEDDEDDGMACICGSSDRHPLGLVQCEFCCTWHHQICTGYVVDETGSDNESIPAPSSHGLWDFDTVRSTSSESWSNGGFMCYHCQSNERPSFASRTTLIVSPEPIHAQWENELSRHVRDGALLVMRYPGVRALKTRLEEVGPSAAWQVLASPGLVLARYDVVLTTYETLAADLRHVPTTEGGDRRSSTRSQSKRYAFVSSPLVALNFWRVCMDEAQVGVENTRLQSALTLSRLSASNRWVVTGTPFSSRVIELFGYLRFLRIPPYTASQAEDTSEVNLQLLQAEQESLDLGFFRESVEHNFVHGAIERVLDLLLWDGQDAGVAVNGGGILWRTGKRHVLDQLGLPPQKSEVVWCHFAAVERHFYDQQEKHIVSLIQQRQRQSSLTSDVIERDDILWNDLLVLRQLCCHPQVGGARQAWGSGGNSTTGTVMTMDAFLQELVNKAKRECEEAQRQLIGAQNGLAGLLVLDSDIPGAALKYMTEIKLIRTNWPHFRADLLPRLHILQNLEKCIKKLYSLPGSNNNAENGGISSEGNAATADPKKLSLLPDLPALEKRISSTGLLPDSGDLGNEERAAIFHECALLGQSAQHIRQYYLLQVDVRHAQALNNLRKTTQEIATSQRHSSEISSKMLCSSGGWWNEALAIVEQSERNNNEQQLVDRVQARLSGFDTRWGTTFCSQLVSTRSLRLLLVRELEALAKRRRGLFERLEALSDGPPTDADIELSGNCAKCRDGGTGPTCVHCQLYKELEAYRKHFLGIDKTFVGKGRIMDLIDDEELDDDDAIDAKATTEGLSVSLFIEIFKEIANCARSALRSQQDGRVLATNIQTSMQTETDFWVKLLREWHAAKKLFQTQHQRLGALDELVMACSQMRLRHPGEPAARTKAERLYKLESVEVPVRTAELQVERTAAEFDLRDKMAQLRYLLQLQSESHTRQEHQPQQNSEAFRLPLSTRPMCAVCLQEFTQRRAVLPCAHAFCTPCISNLSGGRRHTRKSVRCPTCRREYSVESITIVVEGSTSDSSNPDDQNEAEVTSEVPRQISPSGSLGSKLDALLRRVDMLRQENPGVKCLLFSQWAQMLELVVQALPRLGVRCFMYGTKRQLPKLLGQFQACPAACVLALPFKVGANGLNILEATEVILVEPLLSNSIEAQAVNRVHRLGQTRCTRVHRFIVQGSIEERIYRLGHTQTANTEQIGNEGAEVHDDDDEGPQRLGVAPGRKEQEKLTMQDLQVLLHTDSDDTAATAGATALFWEELVLLNEKSVSRRTAHYFLERRHAAEAREESQSLRSAAYEPQTRLFDKPMALLVAKELLELAYPPDQNSGGVVERIEPQILQRYHERITAEIRVWKAAYE